MTTVDAGPAPLVDRPAARRVPVRRVVTVVAIAVIVVELVLARSWLATAADAVTDASWEWTVVAGVLSMLSMVAFGAVRQQTLRAAGVAVRVCDAVSMSFAAGAINTTLPGGAVFSTGYAFRQLRRWGASTSVATWCMAVTGVLAAATLALVGLAGVVLGGGLSGSATGLLIEIGVMIGVLVVLVQVTRNPKRLLPAMSGGLRLLNRLRRRPAETGMRPLGSLVDDLALIRPSRRQWSSSMAMSLANWAFDAATLWAACSAIGVHVSLPALLVTYTAGMAAVSVSPLPAGVGVVEGTLLLGLTAAGAAAPAALAAVLIYRLLTIGLVAAVGWSILAADRVGSRRAIV